MKRVLKSAAPQSLERYIARYPEDTWEQLCDNEPATAHESRNLAIEDQHSLCAYCEQKISSDDPLHRGVEHFHPKSDRSGNHNWGLDWANMLAVCDGGTRSSPASRVNYPLPDNLSCDAYKNHMISKKSLPMECEGYLLDPLGTPAFPNLFSLDKSTGFLEPATENCSGLDIPGNVYDNTAELISHTIEALNLNCDRLTEKRKRLVWDIDHNIKVIRSRGYSTAEMRSLLVKRYLMAKWPEFFTTIRCCIGSAAEEYLVSINYRG